MKWKWKHSIDFEPVVVEWVSLLFKFVKKGQSWVAALFWPFSKCVEEVHLFPLTSFLAAPLDLFFSFQTNDFFIPGTSLETKVLTLHEPLLDLLALGGSKRTTSSSGGIENLNPWTASVERTSLDWKISWSEGLLETGSNDELEDDDG